jgi:hypothetical protein
MCIRRCRYLLRNKQTRQPTYRHCFICWLRNVHGLPPSQRLRHSTATNESKSSDGALLERCCTTTRSTCLLCCGWLAHGMPLHTATGKRGNDPPPNNNRSRSADCAGGKPQQDRTPQRELIDLPIGEVDPGGTRSHPRTPQAVCTRTGGSSAGRGRSASRLSVARTSKVKSRL